MTNDDKVAFELMKQDLKLLHQKVDKIDESLQGLLDAWTTTTGLLKGIKVLSMVVGAFGMMYFFSKDFFDAFFHSGHPK